MRSITCGLYLKSGKLLEMYILCITIFLEAPSSSPTVTAIIVYYLLDFILKSPFGMNKVCTYMYGCMYHYHYHNYGLLLRIEWCLHGGS